MITVADILKYKSEYEIFCHYLAPFTNGNNLNSGDIISSPLREDKHPSFNIYETPKGWCFKDFAGEQGNCFKFVMLLFNVSFPKALDKIDKDFNLGLGANQDENISDDAVGSANIIVGKNYKIFHRPFTESELSWWKQYGVEHEHLNLYGVIAVQIFKGFSKRKNKKYALNSSNDHFIFAYPYGASCLKIYQPQAKKREIRFFYCDPENRDRDHPFGFHQLPSTGELVFWTGGEKDTITLHALNYPAITSTSETGHIPKDILDDLKNRGFEIIILFDNDSTGLTKSEEFSKTYGLRRIVLPPMENRGKDISDYMKLKYSIDGFHKLVKDVQAATAPAIEENKKDNSVNENKMLVTNNTNKNGGCYISTKDEKINKYDLAKLILQNNYNLRRNNITQLLEDGIEELSEQALNSMYIEIARNIPRFSKQEFDVLINSDEIQSYNELKDFISKNENNISYGYIKKLAQTLKSPKGFNYVYTFSKRWLIGMVASIYSNNYNVLLLVLIGLKNTGKTYFFRHLLPKGLEKYYAESKFDQGKDSRFLMSQKLLILNDELDGINRTEAKSFRNFMSADKYTDRAPYGKLNATWRRLASVGGTSNEGNIIQDPEHNRRIIPIEITSIDHDLYNSIDKVALFMEAYHLYKSGEPWELSKEEIQLLADSTGDHNIVSAEVELIQKYFKLPEPSVTEGVEELTTTEILLEIEKFTKHRLTLNNIGKALTSLGYHKKIVKILGTRNNKQVYSVIKVDTAAESTEFGL